jgi:hypothetical protein
MMRNIFTQKPWKDNEAACVEGQSQFSTGRSIKQNTFNYNFHPSFDHIIHRFSELSACSLIEITVTEDISGDSV